MPTCQTCKGKKNVVVPASKTGLGIAVEATCPECKGTGEVGNPNVCQRCNGSKTVILPAEKSPLGIAMGVACPECSELEVLE